METNLMFSSKKSNWRTPEKLYKELAKEFKFDCDPCPVDKGKMHDKDMLGSSWGKSNFVNPPYNQISLWIAKGWTEYLEGKTVVFLLPARTDTKWFHEYLITNAEIRFIKGRLRFSEYKNPAPFPSMICILRGSLKWCRRPKGV